MALPLADVARASDDELLAAVAAGDERAIGELRCRYRQGVERTCRSLARPEAVEDCMQEVFLRIWQKAHLFDPGRGTAPAWLLTLARNVARNLRVRRGETNGMSQEAPIGANTADASVDRLWIEAALERLRPQERSVIELAYFQDLSQPEIAEALAAPLGSVKSWTRRGLNRLATLLAEEVER